MHRKLFYETYSPNARLAPRAQEIGWTHNIPVFERCKDDLEREFYSRMTRKFGWSKSVPANHVENRSYEKTLVAETDDVIHMLEPKARNEMDAAESIGEDGRGGPLVQTGNRPRRNLRGQAVDIVVVYFNSRRSSGRCHSLLSISMSPFQRATA